MYCDVHFPLSAIPFFSRVSYLLRYNLQSTLVAENYGPVDLDIHYYFIISIYVDVHISALSFLAESSLGTIFALHFSGRELCRIRFFVSIHVDNHFCAIPFFLAVTYILLGTISAVHFCGRDLSSCRIRCIMIMFFTCRCLFLCNSFFFLQSCIFFIRDNLCSPRQWQRIMLTCRFTIDVL